ncbi:MAG: S8 family peptidase, partial [Firmicutes bacterium]|nr:S8 family peptidase [Bacillota bacterium]
LSEFIYPTGETRIAACWDQEDRTGTPPEGRAYGSEISRTEINRALESNTPLALNDPTGHGTRLALTALAAAPNAELAIVKLKKAKPYLTEENKLEDSAAYQSGDLMTGLDFIFKKARELGRPVSVIIGMGTSQGAHNGLSLLERYIDTLAGRTGICISAAAGNEGLARHHYGARPVEDRDTIEIAAENSSGFTIWLWNDYLCRTSVGITTPLNEIVRPLQPVNMGYSKFDPPLGSGSISVLYHFPVAEKQLSVITVGRPVNGIWRLNLSFSRTGICAVDAWLPTNRLLSGNVTFVTPATAETLTVPATAPRLMTIGGYNGNTGGVYEFTGRGPNSQGILKPDFTAPAVDVSGSSGTSLGAAVTAGAAALLMQWGIVDGNDPRMRTEIIKAYLIAGTEQPTQNLESGGEAFPNNLWGYGRINLYNTFRRIF